MVSPADNGRLGRQGSRVDTAAMGLPGSPPHADAKYDAFWMPISRVRRDSVFYFFLSLIVRVIETPCCTYTRA